jgi:hypothetical protein
MPGENTQLLTIEELSRHSRLSISTIHRLKRAGKIPCYQPSGKGGRLLFPPDAIERAAAAQGNPSSAAATDEPARLAGPRPTWLQNRIPHL